MEAALSLLLLLCLRIKKTARTTREMKATPPTTPPTIAPIGGVGTGTGEGLIGVVVGLGEKPGPGTGVLIGLGPVPGADCGCEVDKLDPGFVVVGLSSPALEVVSVTVYGEKTRPSFSKLYVV